MNNSIEIFFNIIMIFSVLCFHELAHLITGLLQGFRFELFVVGPLGIKRKDDKIKVYFNTELQYYGGVAATLPTDTNPDNRKKFANLLLAGPISLLLTFILFFIYYNFKFPYSKVFEIGTLASFGIFLATTIPNKTGMFFTDRKRYQRLTSKGKVQEVEMAILRVTGIYVRDNSYINVALKDIETMVNDKDYKYFGLFTKLSYEFETNGYFDVTTKNEFDVLSKKMSKSMVKIFAK